MDQVSFQYLDNLFGSTSARYRIAISLKFLLGYNPILNPIKSQGNFHPVGLKAWVRRLRIAIRIFTFREKTTASHSVRLQVIGLFHEWTLYTSCITHHKDRKLIGKSLDSLASVRLSKESSCEATNIFLSLTNAWTLTSVVALTKKTSCPLSRIALALKHPVLEAHHFVNTGVSRRIDV